MGTAAAVVPSAILRIQKADMIRILHEHPDFSDCFISHMLARNIRIEEDLVDQLFNSSEKRLARTLLLLPATARRTPPPGRCRSCRRRRWLRWSGRPDHGSTTS